jgi:hypothetical protein
MAFALDAAPYADDEGREGTTGVLRFLEELDSFDVMTLLVKPSGEVGRPPTKRAAAAEWLAIYLYNSDGHQAERSRIKDDAARDGHTFKTLENAAADLGVSKVQRFNDARERQSWWILPDSVVARLDAEADDDA